MDLNQADIITKKFNEKNDIKEKINYLVQGAYMSLTTSPLEVKKLKYTQKHVLIGLSEFHIFVCRYKTDQKNQIVERYHLLELSEIDSVGNCETSVCFMVKFFVFRFPFLFFFCLNC
jgi:hypothetical protein